MIQEFDRKIITEDGAEYPGYGFGARDTAVLELVFNTSMVGYQEILSDPSYTDQAVVMTYPLIGNYGCADEDYEAGTPTIGALIVREYNDEPSNFRSTKTLGSVMERYGICGVSGVDTRRLNRSIRDLGSRKVLITDIGTTLEEGLAVLQSAVVPRDAVSRVSCREIHTYRPGDELPPDPNGISSRGICPEGGTGGTQLQMPTSATGVSGTQLQMTIPATGVSGTESSGAQAPDRSGAPHVVLVDCGMKRNILRSLLARGCRVTVVPYCTDAEAIRELRPDGVLLSNGPGDPTDVPQTIATVRELIGTVPIFGICLGHQILSLAYGARTYKLHFGHRGGNHPVKDLTTGRIEITSQNHSYAVDETSLSGTPLRVTHRNLLDNTVEGVACPEDRAFSVQYHPESSPGPQDSAHLFDRFIRLMEESHA